MLNRRERARLTRAIRDALPHATLDDVLAALRSEVGQASAAERDDWYRSIFSTSALGIAVVDRNGRPECCNAALQGLLGYTEHELCSMPFTEFTHPEDVARDWELYGELMSGKRTFYQIEKRYVHKTGKLINGRLSVSRLPDETDRVIGILEDRTEALALEREQKRLSRALAERSKGLAALHEISLIANRRRMPIEEMLGVVSTRLPQAFQYTELAGVRIRCGAFEAANAEFVDSPCLIRSEQRLTDGSALAVELVYPRLGVIDPRRVFAAEEVQMLETVTAVLCAAVERHLAEARLRQKPTLAPPPR